MKIGIDARMADWTGVGRYVIGLLKHFREIDNVNQYLIFTYPDLVGLVPEASNYRIVFATKPILSVGGFLEIGRLANRHGLDLFHAPLYTVPVNLKAKLAVSLHDLTPFEYPSSEPGLPGRRIFVFLNRYAVKKSDMILTDSRYSAGRIEHYFPAAKDRIRVVYLGIEKRFYRPADPGDRGEVADKNKPYILSIGSDKYHKNVSALVEAYAKFCEENDEYKLLLIGDPEKMPRLAARIKNAGLGNRVVFTGEVDDELLIYLYRNASLFVFPSVLEGFGLPPLEAMAAGAPVVCSNRTSLPEVCGEGALLAEPTGEGLYSAMKQVLNDVELASSLEFRGKNQASKYLWDETAKKTLQLYREIVGSEETV